jgi:hypothetical protein
MQAPRKPRVLRIRMLENQAYRRRCGFEPVRYYGQVWSTKAHAEDVFEIWTTGLYARMKYRRTGFELEDLEIDNTYTFADSSHVTGGLRITDGQPDREACPDTF